MYLHFGSRVQLASEPKWGGERHRHNSGPFHKKRQTKTPVSRSGKLALSSFLLCLPISRQDNAGGGAERAGAQARLFLMNYILLLSWRLPPWAACSGITLLQIKIRAAALISQNRRQQKIGVKSNLPRSGFSLFCRWQIFYIW